MYLEHVDLRTNWLKTVEKIIGKFQLADSIQNENTIRKKCKDTTESSFKTFWKEQLRDQENSRLQFYKSIKADWETEKYLKLENFEYRKNIAKLRCSDHILEIVKGRHKEIPRLDRKCKLCRLQEVETEEHFLTKCVFFQKHRTKYGLNTDDPGSFMQTTDPTILGQFISEAMEFRKKFYEWFI